MSPKVYRRKLQKKFKKLSRRCGVCKSDTNCNIKKVFDLVIIKSCKQCNIDFVITALNKRSANEYVLGQLLREYSVYTKDKLLIFLVKEMTKRIIHSTGLSQETPLLLVADWLEERGRDFAANFLRKQS